MRPSEAHVSLYLGHTSRGHSQRGLFTHDGSWDSPQFADEGCALRHYLVEALGEAPKTKKQYYRPIRYCTATKDFWEKRKIPKFFAVKTA